MRAMIPSTPNSGWGGIAVITVDLVELTALARAVDTFLAAAKPDSNSD